MHRQHTDPSRFKIGKWLYQNNLIFAKLVLLYFVAKSSFHFFLSPKEPAYTFPFEHVDDYFEKDNDTDPKTKFPYLDYPPYPSIKMFKGVLNIQSGRSAGVSLYSDSTVAEASFDKAYVKKSFQKQFASYSYIKSPQVSVEQLKNIKNKTGTVEIEARDASLVSIDAVDLDVYADKINTSFCNYSSKCGADLRASSSVHMDFCTFDSVFVNVDTKYCQMSNTTIYSGSEISVGVNLLLDGLNGPGKLKIRPQSDTCLIIIAGADNDLDLLDVPNFGVEFRIGRKPHSFSKISFNDSVKIYQSLVRRYRDLEDEETKYDGQLQKLLARHDKKWLTGFLRENWNYYGHRPVLIFYNSFFLMLLFFSMNLLFFPQLVMKGYKVDQFNVAVRHSRQQNSFKGLFFEIYSCLIFTFFIFWGLRLHIENLKIAHVGYTLLILLQYVVGLVCIGYVANIIIAH